MRAKIRQCCGSWNQSSLWERIWKVIILSIYCAWQINQIKFLAFQLAKLSTKGWLRVPHYYNNPDEDSLWWHGQLSVNINKNDFRCTYPKLFCFLPPVYMYSPLGLSLSFLCKRGSQQVSTSCYCTERA